MKFKSFYLFVLIFSFSPFFSVFSAESSVDLVINAEVQPLLSIVMTSPPVFQLIDAEGNAIVSRNLGTAIVKSNYRNWTVQISSSNKLNSATGRLKKIDDNVYIPYTFELRAGDFVLVSQFDTPSAAQGITVSAGQQLSLVFNFVDPGETAMWEKGTYQDTITIVAVAT